MKIGCVTTLPLLKCAMLLSGSQAKAQEQTGKLPWPNNTTFPFSHWKHFLNKLRLVQLEEKLDATILRAQKIEGDMTALRYSTHNIEGLINDLLEMKGRILEIEMNEEANGYALT